MLLHQYQRSVDMLSREQEHHELHGDICCLCTCCLKLVQFDIEMQRSGEKRRRWGFGDAKAATCM